MESEFRVTVATTNRPSLKLAPFMSGMVRISAGKIRGFAYLMKMARSALRSDLFF